MKLSEGWKFETEYRDVTVRSLIICECFLKIVLHGMCLWRCCPPLCAFALTPPRTRNLTNRQEERIAEAVNAAAASSKGMSVSAAAATAQAAAAAAAVSGSTATAANTPASSITAATGPVSPPRSVQDSTGGDSLNGPDSISLSGGSRSESIRGMSGGNGIAGSSNGTGMESGISQADVAWLEEVEVVEKAVEAESTTIAQVSSVSNSFSFFFFFSLFSLFSFLFCFLFLLCFRLFFLLYLLFFGKVCGEILYLNNLSPASKLDLFRVHVDEARHTETCDISSFERRHVERRDHKRLASQRPSPSVCDVKSTKLPSIQVHSLVSSLERRVNDTYLMEELHSVAKKIRGHGGLFDGTPRRFLREGDLVKYSRTGRKTTYR